MFEISAILPVMKDLTIRLKDYDIISSDDLIGETVIDLVTFLRKGYIYKI
jgi:Ca2+-dependent lipid-binding protein